MTDLTEYGKTARQAAAFLAKASSTQKNKALVAVSDALKLYADECLEANEKDVEAAVLSGMSRSLVDRLTLTKERIYAAAEGLMDVSRLPDLIGEVTDMKKRPNGLMIGRMRVPLGVIGIIYESRPLVTLDAFALCFKSGNACILKGGSDAANSNKCIAGIIEDAVLSAGFPKGCVRLIEDNDKSVVKQMITMRGYIDVVIPRGGAGLIKMVVNNSTVPVIETGTGNCHVYVDESADIEMAASIIDNAKTSRPGVCNACESVVVHRAVVKELSAALRDRLIPKQVEIRADESARECCPEFKEAAEADWGTEYLDLCLSLKTVASIDEAIAHINRYNTGHSECIVTRDYDNAQKFLNEVDAAAVYVNASTRFTDGFEFGFGAEIGISTQKLHARGPMGLEQLTTYKYIIYGNGQVR